MAENKEGQEPQENEDQEKSFWDRMGKLIDERFDAGVERQLKARTPASGSRNGGKQSFPQALAKALGGPFTPVD